MKTKKLNWKKHIIKCLNSTQFLALATSNNTDVWICPVYFSFDKNLNFFFISQPQSRHMKNISINPNVAVAIYSTSQEPRKDVIGIQFEATAQAIKDGPEVKHAHSTYFKETLSRRPVRPGDYMSPKGSWLFVKITPKQMYCFDTKLFGENRKEVPSSVFIK